jgi:hypothetical protein
MRVQESDTGFYSGKQLPLANYQTGTIDTDPIVGNDMVESRNVTPWISFIPFIIKLQYVFLFAHNLSSAHSSAAQRKS